MTGVQTCALPISYIPLEKAQKLGQMLGVEPVIVKEAGHFNESAGYTKFPLLLEEIKKVFK